MLFGIPRLFTSPSACSYAVPSIRLYAILLLCQSSVLPLQEQLLGCISQVEQMMVKVQGLQKVIEDSFKMRLYGLMIVC